MRSVAAKCAHSAGYRTVAHRLQKRRQSWLLRPATLSNSVGEGLCARAESPSERGSEGWSLIDWASILQAASFHSDFAIQFVLCKSREPPEQNSGLRETDH